MKKIPLHTFLLLATLWLFSNTLVAQKVKKEEKPATLLQEAEAHLTEGMKFFMIEEYQKAIPAFEKALEIVPNDAGINYQMAQTLLKANQEDKALAFSQKAYKQDPSNKFYGIQLADLLMKKRQLPEAAKIYQNIIQNNPQNAEYGVELAAIYALDGKYDEAVKAYNNLEKSTGITEELTRQKQMILLKAGKVEDAMKEGDNLIASDPTETDYLENQAELLMTNGKSEKAIPYLEKILQIHPENGEAHLMLAEIFREKGDATRCTEEMDKALADPSLDPSTKARAVISYVSLVKDEASRAKALAMVNGLIKANPQEAKYYAILGDLYLQNKQPLEARNAYIKAARIDKSVNEIWSMVIKLDNDVNQTDSMIVHTEEAIEVFPNQSIFWYQNGAAYLIKRKYDKAVESLKESKRLAPEKFELMPYILSGLGDAYNGMAKHELSDEAYEEALKVDSSNDHVLNNYSYFLSLRKEKMARAIELSSKLIEKYPNNGTYLDTYGWVLYVNKDFIKAKAYLEKAVQLKPRSGTVLEHLGDAQYQIGEKDQALETWKKAKSLGGVSNLLEKKISEGKLIE